MYGGGQQYGENGAPGGGFQGSGGGGAGYGSGPGGGGAPRRSNFVAGKVFVGSIDYNTKNDTLRDYASQWGEVTEAIVMPKGFGFVTFADPANAQAFLEVKEHILDGRPVDVKAAVPKETGGYQKRTRKIFVGGTGETTDSELREYFSQFGEIEDAAIATKDGRSRGFGFVTFTDEVMVEKCLVVPHTLPNGKTVDVKRAIPKEESQGYDGTSARGRGGGATGGRGAGGFSGRGGASGGYGGRGSGGDAGGGGGYGDAQQRAGGYGGYGGYGMGGMGGYGMGGMGGYGMSGGYGMGGQMGAGYGGGYGAYGGGYGAQGGAPQSGAAGYGRGAPAAAARGGYQQQRYRPY